MASNEDNWNVGVGMVNLGNTCYVNASLQALFNVNAFAKWLRFEWKHACDTKTDYKNSCIVCAMAYVLEITQSSSRAIEPIQVYSKLNEISPLLQKGKQNDAHEFLKSILESMLNFLTKLIRDVDDPNKEVSKIFRGVIRSSVNCMSCNNTTERFEDLEELVLNIENVPSITSAMKLYFDVEAIERFECSTCKNYVNATRRYAIERAPGALCIVLNRFRNGCGKIKDRIKVPTQISLSKYASKPSNDMKYRLSSIISHIGNTIQKGHYTALLRKNRGRKDLHYEFDDSRVRTVPLNETTTANAYIVWYEMISGTRTKNPRDAQAEKEEESINGLELSGDSIPIEIIDQNTDPKQDLFQDQDKIYVENEVINAENIGNYKSQYLIQDEDMLYVENEVIITTTIDNEDLDQNKNSHTNENEDQNAAKNNLQYQNVSDENEDIVSGRRIVDISHFVKQILAMTQNTCTACNIGEIILTKEIKRGLHSTFHFGCTYCGNIKRINACPENNGSANINKAAVIGIVSIGLGSYHLEEFLAHLDITCMSYPTYHKLDQNLQADWWKLAKKFEENALNEEIRLAIENNEVDSAGNALIAVEIDGSWGKRSYRNNFSSLSGCAAIIGLRTKKILYSDVKNKYCHICKIAQSKITPPNKHLCNKNYDGPSSGMETQIIVEGFKYCAEKGARFSKYIGDGDSSTYKALRDLRLYQNPEVAIEKFECINHLYRNFAKAFRALLRNTKFRLKGRKLLSSALGRAICVGVRMAAKHWKESDIGEVEKYENLEKDIMNSLLHYLGVHDNCAEYFCEKTTEPDAFDVVAVLKDTDVYYEVLDLCQSYFANNAKSLIAGLCTNKAEGFNSLIAKTLGGKRVCNSLSGSYKSRTNISEVQFNTEGHSGSKFHELIFGNIMPSCVKLENTRKRKLKKNAIAKQAKPKKPRFDEDSTKKKNKRTYYGAGHEDVDLEPSAFELAKNIFFQRVSENQVNRDAIERETRAQRNSWKWTLTRRHILTPSYFGRILNVNNRKSYKAIVNDILYQNIEDANTAEIRHQRIHQMDALKLFSDSYDQDSIRKCGIFIDEEFGFLDRAFNLLYEIDLLLVKVIYADVLEEGVITKDLLLERFNTVGLFLVRSKMYRMLKLNLASTKSKKSGNSHDTPALKHNTRQRASALRSTIRENNDGKTKVNLKEESKKVTLALKRNPQKRNKTPTTVPTNSNDVATVSTNETTALTTVSTKSTAVKEITYEIDCGLVSSDVDVACFKHFLEEQFKVGGVKNNLINKVEIICKEKSAFVKCKNFQPKRYLKHLAKRFLSRKSHYIHVVSTGKLSYQMQYV